MVYWGDAASGARLESKSQHASPIKGSAIIFGLRTKQLNDGCAGARTLTPAHSHTRALSSPLPLRFSAASASLRSPLVHFSASPAHSRPS